MDTGKTKRKIAILGEDVAAGHLHRQGLHILERNYRCPLGEIDIIAQDGETLVFVEVKCRSSDHYGEPQAAVTHDKQRRISRISLYYLNTKRIHTVSVRYDVVAVKLDPKGNRIAWFRHAFDHDAGG